MSLRLDWCSYEAAKFACENWHYSGSIPAGKLVKIGVWENGKFIGVVIFSRGGNNNIGKPFGLDQTEVCELTRVALTTHETPVSKIGAIALKMLKSFVPGMKCVISYADSAEGHHGGIYAGMGWTYLGGWKTSRPVFVVNGQKVHSRTVSSALGRSENFIDKLKQIDPNAKAIPASVKHKYAIGLTKEMKAWLAQRAKPYPKRATSETIDTPGVQPGEGGEAPTVALHI
jgi:hypothetical protein